MRLGRFLMTLACTVALSAGSTPAQEPEKQEKPTPPAKQEQAAAEKAKAEKIAAEKAAKEKADAAKAGTQPEQPKAAVNTLEDLFAAYGMAWNAAGAPQGTSAAPEVTVVWSETTGPEPPPVKPPVKAKSRP